MWGKTYYKSFRSKLAIAVSSFDPIKRSFSSRTCSLSGVPRQRVGAIKVFIHNPTYAGGREGESVRQSGDGPTDMYTRWSLLV